MPNEANKPARTVGGKKAKWVKEAVVVLAVSVLAAVISHVLTKRLDKKETILAEEADNLRKEKDQKERTIAALSNQLRQFETTASNALASRVDELQSETIYKAQTIVNLSNQLVKVERTSSNALARCAAKTRSEIEEREQILASLSNEVLRLTTTLGAVGANQEILSNRLFKLTRTFSDVLSSPARMAALPKYGKNPPTGWIAAGEPCHDRETGHKGSHPRIHNRNFDMIGGAPDEPPSTNRSARITEFTTVWSKPPTKGDMLDAYETLPVPIVKQFFNIFVRNTKWYEQYPPESPTLGVLIPGQVISILRVHEIILGQTFIQYELIQE